MEHDFHAWLRQSVPHDPRMHVPLGDDAAVVDVGEWGTCITTTDLIADGVHFRIDEVPAERIGRKALAVNLSDVAGMAAIPQAAFVSLLLPDHRPD